MLAQLVLKRIGADHLKPLAQPRYAALCSGARLDMGRGLSAVNLVFLPAERSTSDEAERAVPPNTYRTYAVGILSLRQSGTFFFNCVRFSARSAENRTREDR